jgi:hypothetical protein
VFPDTLYEDIPGVELVNSIVRDTFSKLLVFNVDGLVKLLIYENTFVDVALKCSLMMLNC